MKTMQNDLISRFLTKKDEIHNLAKQLRELSADHFNLNPNSVTWDNLYDMNNLLDSLRRFIHAYGSEMPKDSKQEAWDEVWEEEYDAGYEHGKKEESERKTEPAPNHDELVRKAVDHFIKIMDGVEQQHKRIADTFERIAENIEPFFDPDEGLSDLEPDSDPPKKKKSKRPELDIFQVGDRVENQESGRLATVAKAQSSSAGTIHVRYDDGTSGRAWPESLMHVRPIDKD